MRSCLPYYAIICVIVSLAWIFVTLPRAISNEISSPKIAFTRFQAPANEEIYVMDTTGQNLINLTNHPSLDNWPTWSPDGNRIAFRSLRQGDENGEIFTMDRVGNGLENLTRHPAYDCCPAWSPDGQYIAFSSFRDGNWEIYLMDADGRNPKRLTFTPATTESDVAWSPDSKQLAFRRDHGIESDICMMTSDGANSRVLSEGGFNSRPAWAPDGTTLVFSSNRDGDFEIYVLNILSKSLTNLTQHPASDNNPCWSPDGEWIAFDSRRTGNPEIFVMQSDGMNLMQLTEGGGWNTGPAWFDPSSLPVVVGRNWVIWGWLKGTTW